MTARPTSDAPQDRDAQRVVASPEEHARLSELLEEWLAEARIDHTHEG